MNQVGDLKTFRVMGTPPAYPTPLYVWKFWDGSVSATGTYSGSVQKRLNLGGNPAESFTVPYRVDICDSLGNLVQVVPDTVQVNNPPTVVPAPTVNPQDQPFPFQTAITIRAYDLEDNGVSFYWYLGTNPIGGQDTTAQDFTTEGTYYGTLTGLTRLGYTNTFNTTVLESGTAVTCKLVDGDSGTTSLHFDLRGYDPQAPQFSVAASPDTITSSASSLAVQYIAPGQTVMFTAYGYDPTPGNLFFTWYFYGSNGWSQPGLPQIYTDSGTAVLQGEKSVLNFPIATETTAGEKTAVVSVTNQSTGRTAYTSIPVRLILNGAPTITSVGLYNVLTDQAITTITRAALPTRTLVRFSGTASDVNSDVVTFRWDIYKPPAVFLAYSLHGRDAFVDVSDWSAGLQNNIGVVTAYDRYGVASATVAIPSLTVV